MFYSDYYLQKTTEPNHNFVSWINIVETKVLNRFGLNLLDIPDEDYMSCFEDKLTPDDMVQIIKESNGFKQ